MLSSTTTTTAQVDSGRKDSNATAVSIATAAAIATAAIAGWDVEQLTTTFDVLVMTVDAQEARVAVYGLMLVVQVKELVAVALGIESYRQQLYGEEGELIDTQMLCECGVRAGAEEEITALHLIVKKEGG